MVEVVAGMRVEKEEEAFRVDEEWEEAFPEERREVLLVLQEGKEGSLTMELLEMEEWEVVEGWTKSQERPIWVVSLWEVAGGRTRRLLSRRVSVSGSELSTLRERACRLLPFELTGY